MQRRGPLSRLTMKQEQARQVVLTMGGHWWMRYLARVGLFDTPLSKMTDRQVAALVVAARMELSRRSGG